MRLARSLDASAVCNSIMVFRRLCGKPPRASAKLSSCRCRVASRASKGVLPGLVLMATRQVLPWYHWCSPQRTRACRQLFTPPLALLENCSNFMYLKATPVNLPMNLTNTNFTVAHLQACGVFPLEYPEPCCFQGESVGQKGLPG